MKRFISAILIIVFVFSISNPIYADYDSVVSGTGVSVIDGIESLYEASVIARMAGRAGAATESGAKGIVFEVLYSDVKNFFYNIKDGLVTKLSSSSTDPVADLVTTDKNGTIIELIQCKDGTSSAQINSVLKAVSNGKYDGAELVGTREFCSIYGEKAEELGISQMATNSGISTKTTTKIAQKAIGTQPSLQQVVSSTFNSSALAAGITGVISIAESVYNHEDFFTATGNLITNSGISATSVTFGCLSKAGISQLMLSLGATSTVAATTSALVGLLVPAGVSYVLILIAEEEGFKATMRDIVKTVCDKVSYAGSVISVFFESLSIEEHFSVIGHFLQSTYRTVLQETNGWFFSLRRKCS